MKPLKRSRPVAAIDSRALTGAASVEIADDQIARLHELGMRFVGTSIAASKRSLTIGLTSFDGYLDLRWQPASREEVQNALELLTTNETRCNEARWAARHEVGCSNIGATSILLHAEGCLIESDNVGGHGSSQVIFELWSGELRGKRGPTMRGSSQVAA